jgi:MFS family permease
MSTTTYDSSTTTGDDGTIRSLIPARLDRLGWSRFHTRLVIALGVAWILDGLEISIASNVTTDIKTSLGIGSGSVAFSVGTVYLLGEVLGAIVFGGLSDKFGRKNLFMITLGVYLLGGGLTAATAGKGTGWVIYLDACRLVAGMGIGGEYAAINSAVDELIPSKFRGRVDIGINGTYWGGAFVAAVGTTVILNHIGATAAWRIAFLIGPVLAFVILFVRKNLPESPRWLLMHGRVEEAEAAVAVIEQHTRDTGGEMNDVDQSKALEIRPAGNMGFFKLMVTLFRIYPQRSFYGATLMITQSFLYNAIFFTYSLVLTEIYGVSSKDTGYYFMVFAIGNLAGPLVLGKLFDTVGRRKMIGGTYVLSGALLLLSALLFKAGALDATTQAIAWGVIFFFASAGASAAYLTVSEIFPVEVRAKAIAVFFAIAQSFGAFGPYVYGKLIGDGHDHNALFWGYVLGAAIMAVGGVVAFLIGVDAEGKSLEEVASPLSSVKATGAKVTNTIKNAGGSTGPPPAPAV